MVEHKIKTTGKFEAEGFSLRSSGKQRPSVPQRVSSKVVPRKTETLEFDFGDIDDGICDSSIDA